MSHFDYSSITNAVSSSLWRDEDERILLEPYRYLTLKSGKEIRSLLLSAFNTWLSVPKDALSIIGRIVSMLHNASLLVDDIQDDSQLRRGDPVAHKIYGVPQTINTANYVYFLAFQELFTLQLSVPGAKSEDLNTIVVDELLNLHRGQGLELFWRDSLICPTEEEYVGMVNNKTGGLFRLAVRLMMAAARTNTEIDYIPLVNLIGVFFQIRDDYFNLKSSEYATNKGFAEDLTEGKFSFPVVHGIRADKTNHELMNVLQKRPGTPTLKNHAVAYLQERTRSFEYTLSVLKGLEKRIKCEIERLGGNPALDAILAKLSTEEV